MDTEIIAKTFARFALLLITSMKNIFTIMTLLSMMSNISLKYFFLSFSSLSFSIFLFFSFCVKKQSVKLKNNQKKISFLFINHLSFSPFLSNRHSNGVIHIKVFLAFLETSNGIKSNQNQKKLLAFC